MLSCMLRGTLLYFRSSDFGHRGGRLGWAPFGLLAMRSCAQVLRRRLSFVQESPLVLFDDLGYSPLLFTYSFLSPILVLLLLFLHAFSLARPLVTYITLFFAHILFLSFFAPSPSDPLALFLVRPFFFSGMLSHKLSHFVQIFLHLSLCVCVGALLRVRRFSFCFAV